MSSEGLTLPETKLTATFNSLKLGTSATLGHVLTASTDGTATWQINTGEVDPFTLNTPNILNQAPVGIINIAVKPSTIIIGCGTSYLYGSTDLTTNAIESWFRIATAPILIDVSYDTTFGFVGFDASNIVYSSTDGYSWTYSTTLPFTAKAIASNTTCVLIAGLAISYDGATVSQIWKTTNLSEWARTDTGGSVTSNLYDIIYAGSKFVAVGTSGRVLYSTDNGTVWFAPTAVTANTLYTICYSSSGTLFTACGASGTVITANNSDLTTWTSRTALSVLSASTVTSVTCDSSAKYLLHNGTMLFGSSDSIFWQSYFQINGIATNGTNLWVACGYLGLSSGSTLLNLTNSLLVSVVVTFTCCTYFGSLFVIAGSERGVYTSSDASAWNFQDSKFPDAGNVINAMVVGDSGTRLVLVGDVGTGSIGIVTSGTGLSYATTTTAGASGSFKSVAYASTLEERFCAVGTLGQIYTATSGGVTGTWNVRTSNTSSTINYVASNTTSYVAITATEILSSPDGITWTVQNLITNGIGSSNAPTSLIAEGTRYILCVNYKHIFTSTTGTSWTFVSTIDSNGTLLTYSSGCYFSVTTAGVMGHLKFADTNLSAWSNATSPVYTFGNVCYSGTKFITSGGSGTSISTDAVTWSSGKNTAFTSGNSTSAISFAGTSTGSVYMISTAGAVNILQNSSGGDSTIIDMAFNSAGTSCIYVTANSAFINNSSSGVWSNLWTQVYSIPHTEQIMGIAVSSSTFVIYGTRGYMVTSTDGTTWTVRSRTPGTIADLCWDATLAKFYAINSVGQLLTATLTGITWTAYNTPQQSILYTAPRINTNGAGKLLIMDLNTVGPPAVIISDDGTTWETTPAPQSGVSSSATLSVANSIYFIKTGVYNTIYTTDREKWHYRTFIPKNATFICMLYMSSTYIAVGSSVLVRYT